MRKSRRIVILGNSLIIETVGANLGQLSRYEIVSLLPTRQNELETFAPDVVLFDLDDARPEAAFSLLEKIPGLLLVGISPDKNLVKVWSGRQLRELSTKDLAEVIDEQVRHASV